MAFQPDRRFDSLTEAYKYILDQYALQPNEVVWAETASGLAYPRKLPRFLFRGECGEFPMTTDSWRRLSDAALLDSFKLSLSDMTRLEQLKGDLMDRLCQKFDHLDRIGSMALLQHYGLPTQIVDFTAGLEIAFAFAVAGTASVGRVAVMPRNPSQRIRVVDFMAHPWAERAQRQLAYGVLMTYALTDLKSQDALSHLDIKWYEFPILPSDRQYFQKTHKEMLGPRDDPSAGFLRFNITEHVESDGKFSPVLTDWLLNQVPIAPFCYKVDAIEGNETVVYFRASESLPTYDENTEKEHTRRYWSSFYNEDSFDRMSNFVMPAPGSIIADPRTYHPQMA
jgi:hypothetical protein